MEVLPEKDDIGRPDLVCEDLNDGGVEFFPIKHGAKNEAHPYLRTDGNIRMQMSKSSEYASKVAARSILGEPKRETPCQWCLRKA
ncbi:hypothetical protein D3C71_1959890 [compost metagenome]